MKNVNFLSSFVLFSCTTHCLRRSYVHTVSNPHSRNALWAVQCERCLKTAFQETLQYLSYASINPQLMKKKHVIYPKNGAMLLYDRTKVNVFLFVIVFPVFICCLVVISLGGKMHYERERESVFTSIITLHFKTPNPKTLHSKILHSKILHFKTPNPKTLHSKIFHSKILHFKILHFKTPNPKTPNPKRLHSKTLHSKTLHFKLFG